MIIENGNIVCIRFLPRCENSSCRKKRLCVGWCVLRDVLFEGWLLFEMSYPNSNCPIGQSGEGKISFDLLLL